MYVLILEILITIAIAFDIGVRIGVERRAKINFYNYSLK